MGLIQPEEGPLKVLSEWYSRKRPLLGRETSMLENPEDLVSMKQAGDMDTISRILRDNTGFLLGYFHKVPASAASEG